MTAEVKADPAIPPSRTRVYSVLRLHRPPAQAIPPLCAGLGCLTAARAQRSSLWVGCVVPPFIAWRPHPPVWRSPSHFPGRPVIETVFDILRVILSNLHTFRTFAAVLSRIAAFNTPGDPMRTLLSPFRIGSGHRVIRTPLASPTPRKSAPCGKPISAFHPFAFATALLFRPSPPRRPGARRQGGRSPPLCGGAGARAACRARHRRTLPASTR